MKTLIRSGPQYLLGLLMVLTFMLMPDFITFATEDITPDTLISLTNSERTANGLNELTIDTSLNAIALTRATEMAESGIFSHTRPNGKSFQSLFVIDGKYITTFGGENLARGYKSSSSAVNGWKESKSHYETMLNSRFTRVGAAVASDENGNIYFVMEFAE